MVPQVHGPWVGAEEHIFKECVQVHELPQEDFMLPVAGRRRVPRYGV
jgi:hypothetical protein